jgi:hypothetical protein
MHKQPLGYIACVKYCPAPKIQAVTAALEYPSTGMCIDRNGEYSMHARGQALVVVHY